MLTWTLQQWHCSAVRCLMPSAALPNLFWYNLTQLALSSTFHALDYLNITSYNLLRSGVHDAKCSSFPAPGWVWQVQYGERLEALSTKTLHSVLHRLSSSHRRVFRGSGRRGGPALAAGRVLVDGGGAQQLFELFQCHVGPPRRHTGGGGLYRRNELHHRKPASLHELQCVCVHYLQWHWRQTEVWREPDCRGQWVTMLFPL